MSMQAQCLHVQMDMYVYAMAKNFTFMHSLMAGTLQRDTFTYAIMKHQHLNHCSPNKHVH